MNHWMPPLQEYRHVPALRVQAPHLLGEPLAPTAALHAALDLARRSDLAYGQDTAAMQLQVVEPILAGTYVLVSEQNASGQWVPLGWLAYALFDADAERRHLADPSQPLPPADWNRGDRLWIVHWIAEANSTRRQLPVLRQLFMNLTARSLSRRAGSVVTWRGLHCSSREATDFWLRRPLRSQVEAGAVGKTTGRSPSLALGWR
jgi:hemolysin-activating ACP:hemolysin acyltransferase